MLDPSGSVLYQRLFTPEVPVDETNSDAAGSTTEPSTAEPPQFFEQIPVTGGAAQIVVLDPTSTVIGQIVLGGVSPVVSPVTVTGLPTVSGAQTVSWSLVSGSQAEATVQYSADSGNTWEDVGILGTDTSLLVDFDNLPGSQSTGSSLLRVFVSDGVNTGEGDSLPFTVTKKLPTDANIDLPIPNDVFRRDELVILRGSAYDGDDGPLDEGALSWSSNIDGALGTGTELDLGTLSAGQHTVTMVATDSDGNTTSTTTQFTVSSGPPPVSITLTPSSGSGSCAQVTISALADPNVPLFSAGYSLDDGDTLTNIPIPQLPFTFPLSGSGTINILAMAENTVGEEGFATSSFTVNSPCSSASLAVVKLNVLTSPSTGTAGVTPVNIVALGVPSGAITPANVTVSISATCGGTPIENAAALSVVHILGTSYRFHFQVPGDLATGTYFVSITDTASGDVNFASGNCSEVNVTSPTSSRDGLNEGQVI